MFKFNAPKTIVVAIAAAAVAAPAYAGSGISNVRYYGPHEKPAQMSYEQVGAKAEAVQRPNSQSDVFSRAVARGKSKINRGVRPDNRGGTHGIGCAKA